MYLKCLYQTAVQVLKSKQRVQTMPIIGAANAGPLAFKHKMQQQMYHHYFPAVVVTNHRLSTALKIIM